MQDICFLFQKICNKFFNIKSARDDGTLAHIKAILSRTNVNGNVKATGAYEAHKDFITLVAK